MAKGRPYSSSKRLVLDDLTFHRYSAQDAHGTRTDCFYINGVMVGFHAYMNRMRKAMEDTGLLSDMLMANGATSNYRPDWKEEQAIMESGRVQSVLS